MFGVLERHYTALHFLNTFSGKCSRLGMSLHNAFLTSLKAELMYKGKYFQVRYTSFLGLKLYSKSVLLYFSSSILVPKRCSTAGK